MLRPLFLLFVLAMASCVHAGDAPANHAPEKPRKIAFWNPQFSDESLGLDQERLERVASWLREAKFEVQWLRGDQISDGKTLNAGEFSAIFLPGEPILAWHEAPLERFARDGGVLVAVQTNQQPWSVPLVPDMNGKLRRQPRAPRLNGLARLFGTTWQKPQTSALIHEVSLLLRIGWPFDATTIPKGENPDEFVVEEISARATLPVLSAQLGEKTSLGPLISSRDAEGKNVFPAIFALQNHESGAKAMIVGDKYWSDSSEDGGFADAPELWAQLGRFGLDWASGAIEIIPETGKTAPQK